MLGHRRGRGNPDFYPRPPRGGRRRGDARPCAGGAISTHALREEGEPAWRVSDPRQAHFYPRPPRGGRRLFCMSLIPGCQFLPTPSARRATKELCDQIRHTFISTHALREEGDWWESIQQAVDNVFLPTPSARRATSGQPGLPARCRDFYPRPPRGGRPGEPHRAFERRDFYPRPPRGGRRGYNYDRREMPRISTHALREEGDQ